MIFEWHIWNLETRAKLGFSAKHQVFDGCVYGMGETRVLYAIAESCPLDALLVRDMKRAVNLLLQLNLKRFRVPQKNMTKYSALDVMKQALELLYEFSPSERNYREAMRTIQVYSEGDQEMLSTLRSSFALIANAVYNAFSGQRHVESLAPTHTIPPRGAFRTGRTTPGFQICGYQTAGHKSA